MKRRQQRHVARRRLKRARSDDGFHRTASKIIRRLKDGQPVPAELTERLHSFTRY